MDEPSKFVGDEDEADAILEAMQRGIDAAESSGIPAANHAVLLEAIADLPDEEIFRLGRLDGGQWSELDNWLTTPAASLLGAPTAVAVFLGNAFGGEEADSLVVANAVTDENRKQVLAALKPAVDGEDWETIQEFSNEQLDELLVGIDQAKKQGLIAPDDEEGEKEQEPAANWNPLQSRLPKGVAGGGRWVGTGGGIGAAIKNLVKGIFAKLSGKAATIGYGADKAPQTTDAFAKQQAASKEHQEHVSAVDAKAQAAYAEVAAKEGKTVGQVQQEVTTKAQKLVDGMEVYVRKKVSTIERLLEEGDAAALRTQHTVGKSGGGVYAPGTRLSAEVKGMGVSKASAAEELPLSGYLGKPNFGSVGQESGIVNNYGDVVVKLKPAVRGRTTVTFGDSLSMVTNESGAATPIGKVGHRSVHPWDVKTHGTGMLDSWESYHAKNPFIETQVHGVVGIRDIEELGFKVKPPDAMIQKLAARGIKWRVYGGKA